MGDFMNELRAAAVVIGQAMVALQQWLSATVDDADREHHRAELLAAYRRRKDWKKSDIPHLQSLGISPAAQRRIPLLKGKGRPVVKAHQPFWPSISNRVSALQPLVDPASSPQARKRALRLWPWWPHHVEALYRGEHAAAKALGIAGLGGPSRYAEQVVGLALGLSPGSVHSICCGIRRKRREWAGAANFPAMTLREFERWMRTGEQYWRDEESQSTADTRSQN